MSTSTTKRHAQKCGNCNRNCARKGANNGCFSHNNFALEQFFDRPVKYSRDRLNTLQFTIFSLPKEILKQLMGRLKGKFDCLKREIPSEDFPNLSQYTKEKMVSMSTKRLAKATFELMCCYYSLLEKKEETTCAICLDPVDNSKPTCTTKCGHKFCTGCFMELVQRSQANYSNELSCPCCRQNQF
jgi:hypothetical protein